MCAELTTKTLMEILSAGDSKGEAKVRVLLHAPGGVGPLPSVAVCTAQHGFDWESGTFLLSTSEKLTKLSQEEVDAIRESVRKGQSWHAYEAQKKLRERIRLLEQENLNLKAAAATKSDGGALKQLEDFNAYFRSANGVPPNARVSVPTAEWQELHSMLSTALAND